MPSLEAATAEFLDHLRACGRSPHTLAQCQRHLAALASWAACEARGEDLASLASHDVAAFLRAPAAITGAAGKARAPGTVNALRASLRGFFGWATAAGLLERDPTSLLRRATAPPPPPRALPRAELAALLAALDEARSWPERRDRALFGFLAGTGVRLGAAVSLRVEHVDLANAAIEITSKGTRSRLPISTAVADLLADWLPEAGPAFPARSGAPLCARQAQARLRGWCRRAAIRHASPHQLRHSHAMALVERGVAIDVVQALLLHRSVSSTMVYVRASEARLRAALG